MMIYTVSDMGETRYCTTREKALAAAMATGAACLHAMDECAGENGVYEVPESEMFARRMIVVSWVQAQ